MIRNILAIAGSDPSGGAGIQADLKAISANRGYGMAVLTALTAQNTSGVSAIHLPPADFVAAQIAALRADIRIDAIKIGMVATAPIAAAIAAELAMLPPDLPVVLDPVMIAKGGAALLDPDAVATLRAALLPRATVLTPNLPEAAALLDCAPARDAAEMESQARALLALGPGAILLKGGHLATEASPDLLATDDGLHWLPGRRVATPNTHGTGCTLSAALATRLGQGAAIATAAADAKAYVAAAIAAAGELNVGGGHGPTHHFHALWPDA